MKRGVFKSASCTTLVLRTLLIPARTVRLTSSALEAELTRYPFNVTTFGDTGDTI